MSSTLDALTARLHARSDRKLRAFCESRFGDLFDLCGRHDFVRPPIQEFAKLQPLLNTLGAKPDAFPWHGAVWELAKETLFAALRDKWRAQEVAEFLTQVESVNELVSYGEGAQP